MTIDYDHASNLHTIEGPRAALRRLWESDVPASVLDVGCGTGTWLRAALELGASEVFGVDGVEIPADSLLFPAENFRTLDLTSPIDLERNFDAVICLEVAEHLDQQYAGNLVQTLTRHSDYVVFSAACPGQMGQHHVNCQWPHYWQSLFNVEGFYCQDEVRWQLWNESLIEPWYRQNIFVARRDCKLASREDRVKPVLHPEMIPHLVIEPTRDTIVKQIESGQMPPLWYVASIFKSGAAKIRRKVGQRGSHNGHRKGYQPS